MQMNDAPDKGAKDMPLFDGRAAKYITFRVKFLSWAVVNIAGVDELDALRNVSNPATWYLRHNHTTDTLPPLAVQL